MAGETNNLNRSVMTNTQLSKFQTSNDADGQIDAAITASKTVLVTNTNAASVTAADFRRGVEFVLTNGSPVPTAAITITIPAVVRGMFVVRNTTSYTATIGISGQPVTAPTLVTLGKAVFHCDGTNVRVLTVDPAALGTMSTQNANAVAITGGTITGMGTPGGSTDVANKSYVDTQVAAGGLNGLSACVYASAAVLPNSPTYSNGTAGVGATLTAGSNAAIVIDGSTPSASARVLVKDQASALQNGIYTVTTVGSGAAAWVLTRATDFDTAAEMLRNSFAFISSGATNAGSSWLLDATVATVGTDAADFVQFAGGAAPSTPIEFAAKVPSSANWTTFNSSGMTVTEGSVSGGLTTALSVLGGTVTGSSATRKIQGLYRAVPGSSYRVAIAVMPRIIRSTAADDYSVTSVGWYDGTKFQVVNLFYDPPTDLPFCNFGNFSNTTTYNSSFATGFGLRDILGPQGVVWIGFSSDGTNISVEFSADGVNWWTHYTVAKSAGYLGSGGYANLVLATDAVGTGVAPQVTCRCWDESGSSRTLASVYG